MNETPFFKHDNNSRNDFKINEIRIKYGVRGYGIYFCILEIMCSTKNQTIKTNFETLAYDLREDAKVIEDIVRNFGLFKIKRGVFYSESFKKRMEALNNIREGWAKGGKNRWKGKKGKEDEKSIYREFQG